MLSAENKQKKKIEIMEKCFACYCEKGLRNTGIKDLAKACDMTAPNFYSYFDNLDQLIVECTQHGLIKIENEYFSKAPKTKEDIVPYIEEVSDFNRTLRSAEYRFIYQVYTSPEFVEYGKKHRANQLARFRSYSEELEKELNISWFFILSWIISFEQMLIQYALFENATSFMIQKLSLKNMAHTLLAADKEVKLNPEAFKLPFDL